MSWCEIRTEPTGTKTALRMFVGGSPELTIGDSAAAAGSARSATPGTELGPPPCRTGVGDWDETIPMVTNTTRINTARPRTIMAGRMEMPPGVGGRRGSETSAP